MERRRQEADWVEVRCGKPQRRAGYRPLDRVSVWQVVKQRIVDPEVKRPKPYGRLRGQMARRRKCRHTAAKGATRYAVATFLRLRWCHHVNVMSIFALQATPVAASAPCHCMAVTGGKSRSHLAAGYPMTEKPTSTRWNGPRWPTISSRFKPNGWTEFSAVWA